MGLTQIHFWEGWGAWELEWEEFPLLLSSMLLLRMRPLGSKW